MTDRASMHYRGPVDFKVYPVLSTKTSQIFAGDAVWWDKANATLRSAKDFTWTTSLAVTQRFFRAVFVGFAMDNSPAANAVTGTFLSQATVRVAKFGAARLPCASSTLAKETLLSLAKHADGNWLDPQKAAVVTDEQAGIGRSLLVGTAQTTVLFEFKETVDSPIADGIEPFYASVATATAIPVNKGLKSYFMLDVADATETNTLADATWVGQEMVISIKTLAGTGTRAVTAASAINTTGNTIITFDTAGEWVSLKAGPDLKWTIVGNRGGALS